MTQWHADWQLRVPPQCREVRMTRDGETQALRALARRANIADIQLAGGCTVVEIQHSHISTAEVERREAFYGDMVWVVDGREHVSFEGYYKGTNSHCVFLMSGGRGWWFGEARKPVFVDTSRGVVRLLRKTHTQKRTTYWVGVEVRDGGWTFITNMEVFYWLEERQNHISFNDVKKLHITEHTSHDYFYGTVVTYRIGRAKHSEAARVIFNAGNDRLTF